MFVIETAILGTTAIVLGSLRLAQYVVSLEKSELDAERAVEKLELEARLKRETPPIDPIIRKESFQRKREILQEQRRIWWARFLG